ncbi:putative quinol monooxygenase [Flavobacterium aestuarii]|uniref:putative quinol monooxygenase n=1 Tax=Flavobacterium aestuarii TaxID=3149227 RepID=UPI0032B561F0
MKKYLILVFMLFSINNINAQNDMIVRLAEIEIDSDFIKEYIEILKEEASASVQLEAGVISIFPIFPKDNPTQIRILEIYANKEAYESHLKTPHFQKYKSTTLKMVKTLRLADMSVIDPATMNEIFSKLKAE